MTYQTLSYLHLLTVVPSAIIGAYLFLGSKGTAFHKQIGKVYMALMFLTGIVTLFMEASIGPKLMNHFGYLHLFSLLTMYSVPTAIISARRGDITAHKRSMIYLYLGGIAIAGSFAFGPGRFLSSVLPKFIP
ncbi:DUF2306 domain-containing protein [Pseudobacteriovorax antillogorgiicola]|uniref:Uncharacterized membrane protein n=1 Tax=Pseudobacteriovorax antillogorgiicola TaxID=1513793 RepID=A0A1Y6CQI3_9BACT|nr:DUF2306 domain-containing protein [Pseudobacteriovorax antillogorgiicola]TCS41800.1 putative membrane protein [Pseudobacteriovorax antillogorgiicola]SMF83470.1 Uncharacterized membrane protein [Pseudobacteriovorax antillogorgiicola]